jgi:hypothetical protein
LAIISKIVIIIATTTTTTTTTTTCFMELYILKYNANSNKITCERDEDTIWTDMLFMKLNASIQNKITLKLETDINCLFSNLRLKC